VYYFFLAVVVIRYETTATACWASLFIVRAFFNDTVAVAVWTGFHVRGSKSDHVNDVSKRDHSKGYEKDRVINSVYQHFNNMRPRPTVRLYCSNSETPKESARLRMGSVHNQTPGTCQARTRWLPMTAQPLGCPPSMRGCWGQATPSPGPFSIAAPAP
jgi:hypothetical protein